MASDTGSSNISETMRDSIEIPAAKFGIFEHGELDKSVGNCLRQRRTVANGKIGAQKRLYYHFLLLFVVAVA